MRSWKPALVGLLLAFATAVAVALLGKPRGPELLAAVLVAAAAVYPAAALAQGARGTLLAETLMMMFFVIVALLGLWHSLTLLAIGYFGHAGWDLLHHPRRIGAQAGATFPRFCLVYDIAVGVLILAIYR
jgi:hypothetical protein